MPTLTIETNVTAIDFRRRVAKKISLWLHQQDIPLNHAITKFYEIAPDRIFSGPFPFDRFPEAAHQECTFAFITCQIAQNRSSQFRFELARKLLEVIQPEISQDRTFISFQLVDPGLSFTGKNLVIVGKE
jgi:hypothetical protein